MTSIKSYKELRVFQAAMDAAMLIFDLTETFPIREKYSMVDQMRRSSRSVCTNIAEAWRKRRYEAHFVSKLSDAETEAEETCVWLEFTRRCKYLSEPHIQELEQMYDKILGQVVQMITKPGDWTIR